MLFSDSILTEFQGESDVLDNVKESFTAITHKAKLRELIFKTIPLTPADIHTKIESENSIYYTVYQVVFKLLDKKYGGAKRNWSKQRFDEYFIKMKKPHPCGSQEWEILRVGADFRLKCMGCGQHPDHRFHCHHHCHHHRHNGGACASTLQFQDEAFF